MTDVPLKEYVDSRLAAMGEAIKLVGAATDLRFEAIKEFRQALSDNSRAMMTRPEYERAHDSLREKIDALTARLNDQDSSKAGLNRGWFYLVGAMGFVATALSMIYAFFGMRSHP